MKDVGETLCPLVFLSSSLLVSLFTCLIVVANLQAVSALWPSPCTPSVHLSFSSFTCCIGLHSKSTSWSVLLLFLHFWIISLSLEVTLEPNASSHWYIIKPQFRRAPYSSSSLFSALSTRKTSTSAQGSPQVSKRWHFLLHGPIHSELILTVCFATLLETVFLFQLSNDLSPLSKQAC